MRVHPPIEREEGEGGREGVLTPKKGGKGLESELERGEVEVEMEG